MKSNLVTLRAAAAELGVPAHVIVYAMASGKVPEPLRISGRRMFSPDDLDRLRKVVKPSSGRKAVRDEL